MKNYQLFVSLFLLITLSACGVKARAPGVSVSSPGVKVDVNSGSGAGFCPPGQRKKGNC